MAVIVIYHIMAVTVHGPVAVFLRDMGMPMALYHFQVILNGLKDRRRVTEGRCDGPDQKRHAKEICQNTLRPCTYMFHYFDRSIMPFFV